MNQVFDFKRFTLLLAKHWSENRKKNLLGLVAMAGLLFFWFSFILIVNRSHGLAGDAQALTYFTGLVITGCFYGSILFNELSSGPKAMNYLIFPASHFEKLLCGLLYGVVLFFIAYTAIFYLVDIPMVKLGNSLAISNGASLEGFTPVEVVNILAKPSSGFRPSSNTFKIFILMYAVVQSAYILGSVYFAKFSFIKTTIALLLTSLIVTLFVAKVLYPTLPHQGWYNSLTSFRVYADYGVQKTVSLPSWIDDVLMFLVKFGFAPLFWVVTYFRLKEKEV